MNLTLLFLVAYAACRLRTPLLSNPIGCSRYAGGGCTLMPQILCPRADPT